MWLDKIVDMDNNAYSYHRLDQFLDKLRQAEELDESATQECADALRAKISSNIASQLDPYGHPFPPATTGEPVLVNAMQAVRVEAKDTAIEFEVTGPEARHHLGNARGYKGGSWKKTPQHAKLWQAAALARGAKAHTTGMRRALIPFSKLPGPFQSIIRNVLAKRFRRIFKEVA